MKLELDIREKDQFFGQGVGQLTLVLRTSPRAALILCSVRGY